MAIASNSSAEEDGGIVYKAIYDGLTAATQAGGSLAGFIVIERNQATTDNTLTLDWRGLSFNIEQVDGKSFKVIGVPVVNLSVAVRSNENPVGNLPSLGKISGVVVDAVVDLMKQGIGGIEEMSWVAVPDENASTEAGKIRVFDVLEISVILPSNPQT